jgi:RNA polymerase subunit RPABC4/transcription elongation factor Spt4
VAKKNLLNCPYCGSPYNILVQTDGLDKLFRCDACGQVWEYTKSGEIINPEIKKCEICGRINGPGAKVCQNCGHQIRTECPNCGRLIDLDATFCPYCEIHIQNYVEEQKRRAIEEKEAQRLRRIQNLKNEISKLQNEISSKEYDIKKTQKEADLLRKAGRKLYFRGNIGLTDEEKSAFSRVNAGTGCWTKVIGLVLGLTAAQIGWQLFIGISGTRYNNFEPTTFFQNESSFTLYLICGLSILFAAVVARLVYCVVMLLGRQSRASSLASEEENRLGRLMSEKKNLEKKLQNLMRELRGLT